MRKRILSLLLVIIMTISLGVVAFADEAIVASGNCGANDDKLTWTLTSNGTLTISGEGEMKDYADGEWEDRKSEIKKIVIESGVTEIGCSAFTDCTSLTDVVIPDSVTCIDNSAFLRCTNLSEISLPDSVIRLGSGVFEDCTNLKSVRLPQNLTSIPYRFFFGCSRLKSISLPDSVTQIGEAAFGFCDLQEQVVQEIVSSDNITHIDARAFIGNGNIHTVHIGKNVEYIQTETFNYKSYPSFDSCTNLTSITVSQDNQTYTSINGLLCSKDGRSLLYVPVGLSGRLDVPAGIETIGREAMHYALSIKIVHVPKSVKEIGSDAFPIECTDVYYDGTEEQWNEISIGEHYNDTNFSSRVTLHFTCEKHTYQNGVCTLCGAKDPNYKPAAPSVKTDYLISTGKPYIKWAAVAGASKYEVYRSGSKDGTYTLLGTTTNLNYTDSKANAGYIYYYKVKAVNANSIKSNYSATVAATCHCARPVVKPDYLISTGKPYIKWTAVSGASKYYVYRSGSSNGTYKYVGTTTATNYTDNKANAGYTYYYKVKAVSKVSSGANSYYSVVIGATCHCARPSVKITTSNGSPRLTWNAVTGAAKYEVYRATSKNGSYTKMFTTSNLSYTNTSAKAGTTYYYKVKAVSKVKSTANSAFSTVVSIRAR